MPEPDPNLRLARLKSTLRLDLLKGKPTSSLPSPIGVFRDILEIYSQRIILQLDCVEAVLVDLEFESVIPQSSAQKSGWRTISSHWMHPDIVFDDEECKEAESFLLREGSSDQEM